MYSFNQLSACVQIMPVMKSHRSLKAICHFHFFFVMLISSEIIFTSKKDIVSDDWCRLHLFENVNFFSFFWQVQLWLWQYPLHDDEHRTQLYTRISSVQMDRTRLKECQPLSHPLGSNCRPQSYVLKSEGGR